MTTIIKSRLQSLSSSPRRRVTKSENGSKDKNKSQLTRRNHLLNALKITDNKIYELLHEKIIFDSVNSDKNRDLRKRSPSLRYDLINEGAFNFEVSKEENQRIEPVSHFKTGGKYMVKIRYGKNVNLIRKKNNLRRIKLKDEKNIIRIKTKSSKDDHIYETEDIPFNGILSYEDGNTYNIAPRAEDRELFNQALLNLREDLLTNGNADSHIEEQNSNEHEEGQKWSTPTSKIRSIHIANHQIETWYTAPYPEEYSSKPVLYICEYCLKYMNSPFIMARHNLKCLMTNPPGYEIYRLGSIAIFEVDGRKNTIYCQNLCLLLKLFLNSKTLYYDVDPFMFYVLTELDSKGQYHFVGYFSKEKLNSTNYNVSCILTLPIYQRKGYGNLLIDFSYLLTRREFKLGTPEKPLSDLGLLSYRNYWVVTICYKLKELSEISKGNLKVSINDMTNLTGMIQNDVITLLEILEFLIRNPETGEYAIKIDLFKIQKVINDWELKNYTVLRPEKLLFKPVIFGPSGGINTTTTMVMTTDENNNQLMSGISLITNFLKDDIDDSRPLEEQTMEELKDMNNGESLKEQHPDEELDNYLICYPGMDMIKKKRDRKVVVPVPAIEEQELAEIQEELDEEEDEDDVEQEEEDEFEGDSGEEEEEEDYDEDVAEVASSDSEASSQSEDEENSTSASEESNVVVRSSRRIRRRRSVGDLI